MSDEDPIERVNLHVWQPPPPRAVDPAALLSRVVAPAVRPRRTKWIIAALAAANVALVASLLLVVGLREPPLAIALPAGGPVDSDTREALRRLEQQQAQLTRQLADVEQLRATIASLSDRVQRCEQQKTVPSPSKPSPKPSEVVLGLGPTIESVPETLETLDRAGISGGVDTVRPAINACGDSLTLAAPVRVKVHVKVAPNGRAQSTIEDGLNPAVAQCVVREMNKAKFPRTKKGATFSYPFIFGLDLE